MKEFTIGRNEGNNMTLNNDTVSGEHAEIEISHDFGQFVLKDRNSTNGTKVNGRLIVSKSVKKDDLISFGDVKIQGKDLFSALEQYVINNRIDFTQEFGELEKVERNYKDKKRSLSKHYRFRAMIPKMGITLLVVLIISLLHIKADLRYLLMLGASVIGGAISTLGVSERKKEELLDDLKIKFQLEYVCPKCGMELYGKDWRYWKEKKKCRNNACNAEW